MVISSGEIPGWVFLIGDRLGALHFTVVINSRKNYNKGYLIMSSIKMF